MDGFNQTQLHLQHNATGAASALLHPADSGWQQGATIGSSTPTPDFEGAISQANAPTMQQRQHGRGLGAAQDNEPIDAGDTRDAKGKVVNLTQLGQQFDTISKQLGTAVGDLAPSADFSQVFKGDKAQVLQELGQVETGINTLLNTHPGRFQGVTGVKLHTIANQINIEQDFIQKGGASSAIGVRDVQRDILDIVNNDAKLTAAANRGGQHGFTPLEPLQHPAQPFQTNAAQTQFLNQTNQTLNSLVQQAGKFLNGPPNGDSQQLIQQIRTFDTTVSNFASSQGGVYSARFNNELAQNGTNDTAAAQFIRGLETHDKKLVLGAEKVLLANMGDVGANQIPVNGGSFAFAANNPGA